MAAWPDGPGVLVLPSGLRIRGRGLDAPAPSGPDPDLALHLLDAPADPAPPWPAIWVDWPDFGLPRDPAAALAALARARERAAAERVELACAGGCGRTGTALAALAVLDGVPAAEAVALVRAGYRPDAVETAAQEAFVRGLARPAG